MGDYKNADLGEDFFITVDQYLEEPNPYVTGNQKWRDLFVSPWLEVMRSMDGKLRFIPLDTVPISMAYNKDIFAQAGITEVPVTYKEFIEAQNKLSKLPGVIPFITYHIWYSIFLEGSLLADKVDKLDVLIPDGVLDAQEIARGYDKGEISFLAPEYYEWASLIKETIKYMPTGWQSMDTLGTFVQGKAAITEAIGGMILQVENDKSRGFDVGFMPYPLVTTETTPFATSGMIRGNAGFSTTLQITNTAVKNKTVDQCIDWLRYITEPKTNARMVNALGQLIPGVIGAESTDLYKPLTAYVEQDMAKGYKDWHAMVMYGAFDGEWYSLYYDNLRMSFMLGEISVDEFLHKCDEGVRAAIKRVEAVSNWDRSKW
jgi:ABC-type glycerol-3-phosphate transport system substrate-binding protein